MSLQRNVQEQNADTKAGIARVAALFASGQARVAWLAPVLLAHGLVPRAGMLAELGEVFEQEGNQFSGLWLTEAHAFWAFTAMVSRESGALVELERFEEITAEMQGPSQRRGTGRAWAQLAVDVLRERAHPGDGQPSQGVRKI